MEKSTELEKAMRAVEKVRGMERWSAAGAQQLLEVWKTSGESLAGFAERHGFSEKRLRRWKEKIGRTNVDGVRRRKHDSGTNEIRLAPVIAQRTERADAWTLGCAVALILNQEGVRIEIHDPSAIAPDWIREIVRGLGAGARG